jgi:hypothetical protein
MLLYSWAKIFRYSKAKSNKILDIFTYIVERPIPLNKADPAWRYSQVDWSGKDFILNPEAIIEHRAECHPNHLARYIGLASRRKYGEYKLLGTKTLDLVYCPVDLDAIKHNKLLLIKDDKIHFLWE